MIISAEWLKQKYEVEGLDCVQIGRLVSRDPKTVWAWLKKCGIQTRPRGSNWQTNLLNGRQPGFKQSDAQKQKLREARLADGHFPKQSDGRPYWAGKTGEAHPTWRGGVTPERQAFYASLEWKAARQYTYARAKSRCERCGIHSSEADMHVHHVMPFFVKSLRAARHNLRLLCVPCHRFVHSGANGEREFLPIVGVWPFMIDGTTRLIPISYRPKHKAKLPEWL